jgi:F0F1-type ATP synthase assembly protein I
VAGREAVLKPLRSERELRVRRAGTAYQATFEAVFAILIGVGLGYWVDASFDSSPWGLLAGFALGFGAFALRLVRLARQLQGLADGEDGKSGRE